MKVDQGTLNISGSFYIGDLIVATKVKRLNGIISACQTDDLRLIPKRALCAFAVQILCIEW